MSQPTDKTEVYCAYKLVLRTIPADDSKETYEASNEIYASLQEFAVKMQQQWPQFEIDAIDLS